MARDVKWVQVCDPCNRLDIPNAEAVTTHLVSVDGGPLKEVDVCARDEEIFQQFLRDFIDGAREVPGPETEPAPAVKKRKPKALKAAEPKQLEKPPAEDPPEKKKQFLVCPLPHSSTKGGPLTVDYNNRGTHAQMVHGVHVWEVPWQDPDGILKVTCTEHDFCNGLGFTAKQGLSQHIVALRKKKPATEEGASQKADEPTP